MRDLPVVFEILIFVYAKAPFLGLFAFVVDKPMLIPVYQSLLFSKISTLILIYLVSIGTLAKKKPDFDPRISMIYPLLFGLLLFFSGLWLCVRPSALGFAFTTCFDYLYMVSALFGALLVSLSLDNVSKMIRSGLGKDKWNVEQESFMQSVKLVETDCSVNIPMQFYYKGKVRDGWINLNNVYKSMMVVGVPGSGKTWSVVNPAMRQLMAKSLTMVLYDFKFPVWWSLAELWFPRNQSDFGSAESQDQCFKAGLHHSACGCGGDR